jgi:hypothetical protein
MGARQCAKTKTKTVRLKTKTNTVRLKTKTVKMLSRDCLKTRPCLEASHHWLEWPEKLINWVWLIDLWLRRNGTVQHSRLSKISIARVHDNITIYNCLHVLMRHEIKTVTSETKTVKMLSRDSVNLIHRQKVIFPVLRSLTDEVNILLDSMGVHCAVTQNLVWFQFLENQINIQNQYSECKNKAQFL